MKMNRIIILVVVVVNLIGCTPKYNPDNYLSTEEEKEKIITYFLPFVIPRPDNTSMEARFSDSLKGYYREQMKPQELSLARYFISQDSVHYCMFVRRDLKSLYVDYRAIAATFNKNKDSIYNMELKFLTPMFRADTIYKKADLLFETLINKGSIDEYVGNRDFVDWPSQDVYYDKQRRMWALKKSSEWNNLQK